MSATFRAAVSLFTLGHRRRAGLGHRHHDVLVLAKGLIQAETPPETEHGGRARLDTLVRSGSMTEVAARHRFVPHESMADRQGDHHAARRHQARAQGADVLRSHDRGQ